MSVIESWPKSHHAWQRTSQTLAGGVSTGLRKQMPPHPLFFERGAGSRILDVDGNWYRDYVLGWGPLFLGHSHPEVLAAVGDQLGRGQTFGSGHRAEYEAAELLVEAVPHAERVLWSNTGTEANQSAFRLARAHTGRQRILKFVGNYHGWMDNVLVSYRGDEGLSHPKPGAGTNGQSLAAMTDVHVAPWNDLATATEILEERSNDIAAVIVETVLANTGLLAADPDFVRGLREVTTRLGIVLIFDEVITGFRLALGGAREHYGVTPDLSVYAKSLASGFSLAAIAGRADIIEQVNAGVVHAGTYNGNPIALSAAVATLTVLTRDNPYEALTQRASRLAQQAQTAMDSQGVVGSAHAVGPIVQMVLGRDRLETVEDYLACNWGHYDELIVALLRRGQFVLPGGRWYLSTAHDDAAIDESVAALSDALGSLRE